MKNQMDILPQVDPFDTGIDISRTERNDIQADAMWVYERVFERFDNDPILDSAAASEIAALCYRVVAAQLLHYATGGMRKGG